MRRARIHGTPIRGALIRQARIHGTTIRGASIRSARIGGAPIRGAPIRRARIGDALIRGALIRGALIRGALIRRAYELRDARDDVHRVARSEERTRLVRLTRHRPLGRPACAFACASPAHRSRSVHQIARVDMKSPRSLRDEFQSGVLAKLM
jgi:hypothetical protein